MQKGFSLIELIISIGLISIIFLFSFTVIRGVNTTYADPYEELRSLIADAAYLYLNTNGNNYRDKLYENGSVTLNSNMLIEEGLLENEYYVSNIKENKNVENFTIIVTLDREGFINYSINIV